MQPRLSRFYGIVQPLYILALVVAPVGAHAGWTDWIRKPVEALRASQAPLPHDAEGRPYAYRGPARPPHLKKNQYLSLWSPDFDSTDEKTQTLDLNPGALGLRGWLDLDVNRFSGETSITTPAVFEAPLPSGLKHKTLGWYQPKYSSDFTFFVRVKDADEARELTRFLTGITQGYEVTFDYMRATPAEDSHTHRRAFQTTQVEGTWVEKEDSRYAGGEHFNRGEHSLVRSVTLPSEGDDFLLVQFNLDALTFEADPARPGLRRKKSDAGNVVHELQREIFRRLAPHDLVFVYTGTTAKYFASGGDLKHGDRTISFVEFGGNLVTTRPVHGNLRALNQRLLLNPELADDINRQSDQYFMGMIRMPSEARRPVMVDLMYNGLRMVVRTRDQAEAAAFAAQLPPESHPRVLRFKELNPSASQMYAQSPVEDSDHFIDFTFLLTTKESKNATVTSERLLADGILFFAKHHGLKLVDAQYARASLDQFDRLMPVDLDKPMRLLNNCGGNL